MKKGLKITLIVLMFIALVFSVFFNIFAFKSSYGALMFTYEKEKYEEMVQMSEAKLVYTYNGLKIHTGIQVKGENVDNCESFEAQYYVEADGSVNVKTVCEVEDKEITYYYADGYLYKEEDGIKSVESMSYNYFISQYPSLGRALSGVDGLFTLNEKSKTYIAFSFSPFYVIGIGYSYKKDDVEYEIKYDLKGRLRNVKIDAQKDTTLEISYSSKDIDFPDLTDYE